MLLAGCGGASANTTTTTTPSEATFGSYPYWNTFAGPDGYWSVVYLDPYWANFTSSDGGAHWQLKTPTNISPRRGIAVAESLDATKAVGFFAYQGQQNSVVFTFNNSGANSFFVGGPLVDARQSLAFSAQQLFALRQVHAALQIVAVNPASSSFELRYSQSLPLTSGPSAIGFNSNNPQDGVAILSATSASGSVANVVTTTDSGATWNKLDVRAPSGSGDLYDAYIPQSFGSNSYEFLLVDRVAKSYETVVETPGGTSAPQASSAVPVIGSDPNGDVVLVDNVLGVTPTLSIYSARSNSWSPPVAMGGFQGAIESIAFSNPDSGMAISNFADNLRAFSTSDGGKTWIARGALLSATNG